jgi:hypothetical protein
VDGTLCYTPPWQHKAAVRERMELGVTLILTLDSLWFCRKFSFAVIYGMLSLYNLQ